MVYKTIRFSESDHIVFDSPPGLDWEQEICPQHKASQHLLYIEREYTQANVKAKEFLS